MGWTDEQALGNAGRDRVGGKFVMRTQLSKTQIIALAAVFSICVSTLLLFAPGRDPVEVVTADVTRSESLDAMAPAELSSNGLRGLGASEDHYGATRQVYALDRPASGVLVTLGTAHLDAATEARTSKMVAPQPAKVVAAPAQAPVETPLVGIATPVITPKPVAVEEDFVTATAPVFESDDELIDTAVLLSQMTASTPTEPRVYTVVAGDSLASIAARFYGTTDDAVRIFEANRATLHAPESILVGQVLILP